MKSKSKVYLRSVFTNTAIICGVLILYNIVLDVAGVYYSSFNMIAGSVLYFAGISWAIYNYRKESLNNVITFSQALGYGVFVALLYGIVISFFSYIHQNFISPDLYELGKVFAEEKMLRKGIPEAQIEMLMEQQERFKTFFYTVFFGSIMNLFTGFIFSLIASAFLKKEASNPFEGVE